MKLIEALAIVNRARQSPAPPLPVLLACGFTPSSLATYLSAHLQTRYPGRLVQLRTGLYGDLAGTLEKAADTAHDAAAVVIEWSDLDARLGVRQLGGWSPRKLSDIRHSVEVAAHRLQGALERLSRVCPVGLSLPTLPLPPVSYMAGWQAGAFEVELDQIIGGLARWAAENRRVRLIRRQRLDKISPPAERFDLRSELLSGFPYRQEHANAVAELLALALANPLPKKGLITDLDDTLWCGILGEVGVAGISWDLQQQSHVHALYQQVLCALAEAGVLIGIASKNDPALVEEALQREDLLLAPGHVYPVRAHWGAKSASVGEILKTWNIAADSVVFVDDSPMELAEVEAAHPGIECLSFPKNDAAAVWTFLERLRDLFGKSEISDEDHIRLASLREARGASEVLPAGGAAADEFLSAAKAVVMLDFRKDPSDPRALELVNKTNQFNINGRRYTEAEWHAYVDQPDAFLLRVSYQDKFGPLGKIAVLTGRVADDAVTVDTWVMSCRAFSRRIEHQCLRRLFARFAVARIVLDFRKTDRNGPVDDFLVAALGPEGGGVPVCVPRDRFEATCPPLFHEVKEVADG